MFALALLLALGPAAQPASGQDRVKLVFSIDQGFGNGVVVNRDAVAVRRIAECLKTLRPRCDVYALLNPHVKDKSNLDVILNVLAAEEIPFVFDACSSDSITLGTTTAFNAPADGPHGVAISLEDLARYRNRYGKLLAGLRFMEMQSMDFTIRAVRTTNPEWNTAGWTLPAGDFFQAGILKPYLAFAREHRMFVQWSDWHWTRFHGWDKPLAAQEKAIAALLREFPGLVTVTYANNEPKEDSVPRLNTWHEAIEPLLAAGAAGIGLSDQAWLREPETGCPPTDVVAWAKRALTLKCRYIQFEPAWYFFELPRGSFGREDYTGKPEWQRRGLPREAFQTLARAMLDAAQTRPTTAPQAQR